MCGFGATAIALAGVCVVVGDENSCVPIRDDGYCPDRFRVLTSPQKADRIVRAEPVRIPELEDA